jgi:Ca-activated chloride channel family protein
MQGSRSLPVRPRYAPLPIAAALAAVLTLWSVRAHAAGLLVADGGLGGVLKIEAQRVNVSVNNGIAVTEVEQVFRNTEKRQVEALYTFPVPNGASVAGFTMWINGKEMVGEVVEKQRARQIYDRYKQVRRDPGLLEQTDYKTFEMRIFPIGPGAEQRVRIVYYQELDFDHDAATYVYPLATVTRRQIDQTVQGTFALSASIESAVPIVSLESPSHPKGFAIVRLDDAHYDASLETATGDLARDVVLTYRLARPHTGLDLITSKPPDEDGYFQLTLTAGEELATLARGMDYVFILDVSGSMADDGKLRLSRQSLGAFIRALERDDRFEVMTFNIAPRTLFQQLVTADDEAKARAGAFLTSQEAMGGTVLNPAITAAYRYATSDRPLNVVVLSDGLTEQSERTQLLQLMQSRPANTKVFCVGVGNEVNRPLLTQLAEDAGGLAAFISLGDDFERQAQAFRRKLTRPVATNLAFTFSGGEVYDVEPTALPSLYHGAPLRVYGRYRKGGPVTVSLRGDVGSHELAKTVEFEFPDTDGGNPEIERMWAWRRVDRLLKEADRAGARAAVVDEVVRLGEAYSITSEYASFLVLENDQEYQRWKIERRNALRLARDRRHQEEIRAKVAALRTAAADQLGPAAPAAPVQVAANQSVPVPAPARVAPAPRAPASTHRSRGRDFDLLPEFGGGGAIDPVGGALVAGLGVVAWASRRRHARRRAG